MRLEPLYVLRYVYDDGWAVRVGTEESDEQAHFYFADGRCDGAIRGEFRAANHPRRRSGRGPFEMNMQGVITTDDGAVILVDCRGFGRADPPGRRQVVGAVWHLSDDERYSRLNDAICVISGEVRAPDHPPPVEQREVQLVFEVNELIWEAPPD